MALFNHDVLLLGLGGGTLVPLLHSWINSHSHDSQDSSLITHHSSLTAVELDPVVVDLARRFFGIKDYEDSGFLKVVVGDAFEFISRLSFHPRGEIPPTHTPGVRPPKGDSRVRRDPHTGCEILVSDPMPYTLYLNRYTLIVVDLYLGEKFPSQAESDQFMKNLKKLLAPGGTVIFNRLRSDKLIEFEKTLRQNFSEVSVVTTPANLFFLAS